LPVHKFSSLQVATTRGLLCILAASWFNSGVAGTVPFECWLTRHRAELDLPGTIMIE
jgi:hypothetical protein